MSEVSKKAEVEEFEASRIARHVADEFNFRETVDQTPVQFYLGTSIRSALLRVTIVIAALFLYISYYESFWPIIAVAVAIEIKRLNDRVNALNRLFQLHAAQKQRINESSESSTGSSLKSK